jgi:hypothetical protein
MIEWFSNIYAWFAENKDAIILFFSSGQFLSLLAALFVLIRNIKAVKNNTSSSDALNQNILKNAQLQSDASSCKSNTDALLANSETVQKQIADVEGKLETEVLCLTDKLNTVLEVMSIVYGSIKDEKVRSTVNSLLTNAKYAESTTRAELQRQIVELKSIIKTQLEQLNKDVEERVEKVTNTVGGETNVPERY